MSMYKAQTILSVQGTHILINDRPTYEGCEAAEGLLLNLRAVSATFDDTLGQVSWWDDDGSRPENNHAGYAPWRSPESADANTERFIQSLPEYRAWGILAVNLNVQGGHPILGRLDIAEGHGSAGARPNGHRDFYHNSGFRADGSLDPNYATRIGAVIEACDRLGMAVILQLFYFGQDTALPDEDAIRAAVDAAVDFICTRKYRNVLIEIANEVMQGHYHHDILKPGRVAELIRRVRSRAHDEHHQDLLVSTSEAALLSPRQWTPDQIDDVFRTSDVVLLHGGDDLEHGKIGDTSEVADKIEYIQSRPWFQERPRPIVFNESDGEAAFDAAVRRGASFGLHSTEYLQTMWPPKWGVWENDILWFFRRVRELTCQGEQP